MNANLVRAEWTKLRSVRSTKWSMIIVVALALGVSTLATWIYSRNWATLELDERLQMQNDPIGLILQPSIMFVQIAVCVFAALVIASEYSSGTISASVLAVPKRVPILLTKLALVLALIYGVGEVVAFASFFIGKAIMASHVQVSLSDTDVLRALLMYGVYLDVVAMFGFGIASILRRTAPAITIGICSIIVLPGVVSLLPGDIGDKLTSLVPASNNAQMVLSMDPNLDYPFSAGASLAAFAGWAVVAMAVSTWLMVRRDV